MAETIKVGEKEVKVKDLQGKGIYVIAKQYGVDIETAFNARADANLGDDEEDKKEELILFFSLHNRKLN